MDTAFIGPGLLFMNQYLDTMFSEDLVLWLALVSMHAELTLLLSVVNLASSYPVSQ